MSELTPFVPSPRLFSLENKNVLITGATRGIGRACAIALAQAGASVCIVSRSPDPPLPPGDNHTHVVCDLSDSDAVKSLFQNALDKMGGNIHILVNCAGIQRRAPSVDFSEQDWDDVINTNLKSVWILCQAAGRHMVPLRRGHIINFASLLTFQGGLTVPAYASAKGAVGQLTKALSNEWSAHNVQVNAIAPGYIETDMNSRLLADPVRFRQISERIPAGRWGKPEDFAGPIVFLASEANKEEE
ncbi:hypothetical protein Clacol_009175 [Clathrus columnatus]|uniref:Ketoreductase domain-containing protein n=1 Tax=Clathrus columnatus TaxID=1419009 RepID=A0AAV5ASN3_9AGAM|nr:hypothetical protein Clacol_009175 [Clathrus columnatus]